MIFSRFLFKSPIFPLFPGTTGGSAFPCKWTGLRECSNYWINCQRRDIRIWIYVYPVVRAFIWLFCTIIMCVFGIIQWRVEKTVLKHNIILHKGSMGYLCCNSNPHEWYREIAKILRKKLCILKIISIWLKPELIFHLCTYNFSANCRDC